MTPTPFAARRLSLLGCLTAVTLLALTLSACGSDAGTTAAKTAATQAEKRAPRTAASAKHCQRQVGGLLRSMDTLRKRLEVGLTYEEYSAAIGKVRAIYDGIPAARLKIECLATTGAATERALNEYIDAANAWGECLAEAGCNGTQIAPRLQKEWRVAAHFLLAAQA